MFFPRLWPLALVLAAVAYVYAPTLSQNFLTWDDPNHLLENPATESLDPRNIAAIFQSTVNKTYIPLTTLSFAIERHFAGLNPFIYHVDNLLLHLAVVAMVYALALRLGCAAGAAALGAFIFGIHPMHVESVAWVTERKDVLYSFFYLISILAYTTYIQKGERGAYAAALGCAVLSVLAKPMALSLPLILILLDWFYKRPWSFRLTAEKIPFALCLWPIAWQTYILNARHIELQFPQSFLTWIWSLAFYITKFACPEDLVLIYSLPKPIDIGNPPFAAAIILVIVSVIVLIVLRSKRLFVFAAAYFFLSIFFLLRFDDARDFTLVADRFMYLPSVGICLLCGAVLWQALEQSKVRWLMPVLAAVICVGLYGRAYVQVKEWDDEVNLWSKTVTQYPRAESYHQLGVVYFDRQEYDKAIECNTRAIQLNPTRGKPYINRGMSYLNLDSFERAVADYTAAIDASTVKGTDVTWKELKIAFNNRGLAYVLLKQPVQALNDLERALSIDPAYVKAYINRARAYYSIGKKEEARADLERALRVDPTEATAQRGLRQLDGLESLPR